MYLWVSVGLRLSYIIRRAFWPHKPIGISLMLLAWLLSWLWIFPGWCVWVEDHSQDEIATKLCFVIHGYVIDLFFNGQGLKNLPVHCWPRAPHQVEGELWGVFHLGVAFHPVFYYAIWGVFGPQGIDMILCSIKKCPGALTYVGGLDFVGFTF